MPYKHGLAVLVFWCNALLAFAQPSPVPKPVDAKLSPARQRFYSEIGAQSRLYNGPLYEFYSPDISGSAYFNDSGGWYYGTLVYDGTEYENVPLLYDMYKGLLITNWYDGYSKLSLVTEKVSSFSIYGHHFLHIVVDSLDKKTPLHAGFYDKIFDGELKMIVKRTKGIQLVASSTERYFTAVKNEYFLQKDGVYYPIDKEGSFMDFFGDQKKSMKQLLKSRKIKFRKSREEAMLLVLSAYEHVPG